MVVTIERVRAVDGKVVREKTQLPSGFSGMTRKEQTKSLKEQLSESNKTKKKIQAVKIKKILKKPTAKLPIHSPTKFIAQLAQSQGQLVREVPDRFSDPVQDNRSLFFRAAFEEEKRKAFGGFL